MEKLVTTATNIFCHFLYRDREREERGEEKREEKKHAVYLYNAMVNGL